MKLSISYFEGALEERRLPKLKKEATDFPIRMATSVSLQVMPAEEYH